MLVTQTGGLGATATRMMYSRPTGGNWASGSGDGEAAAKSAGGALFSPSGACGRFFDCVGLDVECRNFTSADGQYSEPQCAVNGGEFAYVMSGICGSPTVTAGRFGVPWGKAQTEWANAKAGEPCGYDPSFTIQEGDGQEGRAEGSPLVRTRGSAESPNQPLSGQLLFDTISQKCGVPWSYDYAALSASERSCVEGVKEWFRRRGYNFESLVCRGANQENMLECSPVFIPQSERTLDWRRENRGGGGPIAATSDDDVIGDFETGGPQQEYTPPDGTPPTEPDSTDPIVDPDTGALVCPAHYPHSYVDPYNQLVCYSNDPRAWLSYVTGGQTVVVDPGQAPGAGAGGDPGNGSQYSYHGGPVVDGGNYGVMPSTGLPLDTGGEWVDGVPNWAVLAGATIAGMYALKQLK